MQEIHHFFHSLFSPTLDFRVRLFNILALGGTVISLIMTFLSLGTGSWRNVLINFALVAISGGLFLYSYYSGKYPVSYTHLDVYKRQQETQPQQFFGYFITAFLSSMTIRVPGHTSLHFLQPTHFF